MNANIRTILRDAAELAILRQRAQALACEGPPARTTEPYWEVIEFVLGHENYAIQTAYVREVCPVQDLTPVPCTPPLVGGIINLRGQILAVLELKYLLGLSDRGLTDRHHVIVLQSERVEVGILADAIQSVREVRLSDLHPAPPMLLGQRAEYLRGVTAERLIVLDALRLLSDSRLVIYDEER